MSNRFKDLYDYDLVKECYKSGIILLESKIHRYETDEDWSNSNCKVCRKQYYNENLVKIKKKI